MRRSIAIGLVVCALLALATAIAWAAEENHGEGAGLAPTGVSLTPEVPYPGQKVQYTLEYSATTSLSPGTVTYTLEFQGQEEPPAKRFIPIPEAGMEAGAQGVVTDTFYAPAKEDTYVLIVTMDGQELRETFVAETALPSNLAQLFAGLGVFAAVMAIMAVGTEVVLEPVKSLLGMKQKVTAMEAFDQLKQEIPGQLAGLGVDAQQVKEVQDIFGSMETALEPVQDINSVVAAVKAGLFGDAYETIEQMKGLPSPPPQDKLDELKDKAKAAVEEGFAVLQDRLHLSDTMVARMRPLITKLKHEIDRIDPSTLQTAANVVGTWLVHDLQKALVDPEWAKNWLDSQAAAVLAGGKKEVEGLLASTVIPTLTGLGFPPPLVTGLERVAKTKLGQAQEWAERKMNDYTEGVKNLLRAVEDRRQQMQGPARKLWRRLRRSHMPFWPIAGVIVAVAASLLWFVGDWYPVWEHEGGWEKLWVAFSTKGWWIGLAACVAYIVLAAIGSAIAAGSSLRKKGDALTLSKVFGAEWRSRIRPWLWWQPVRKDPNTQEQEPPPPGTLGYALGHWFERTFNWMGDRRQDVEKFGKIEKDAQQQIDDMDPKSVASTILQREDKHRDEETSRLRWLRVFSIVVGVALAYWLKIDAAVYLNYAVPGLEGRINDFVKFAVLHERWALIPADMTVGILLTGLAASAGSKFWRDLLGRLQTARGQAEEAARLVRKVRGMVGSEQEQQP
jgi:hypothetical protein